MNESAGKLEVRVGDGASGVVGRDEEACNVLWPLNAPKDRNVIVPPLPRMDIISWERNSSRTFARVIMMTFHRGEKWDDLDNTSGAGLEILCYPPEVAESLVESFAEVDYGLSLVRD